MTLLSTLKTQSSNEANLRCFYAGSDVQTAEFTQTLLCRLQFSQANRCVGWHAAKSQTLVTY